jgi:uncharacterized protein YlxW (UPF0749 family)
MLALHSMSKTSFAPKTQTAPFMLFSGVVVMLMTTLVLALFLNRINIRDASDTAPTRRIQDLIVLLQQAEKKQGTLETEVDRLRKKLVSFEHNSSLDHNASKDPELQKLFQLAGLTSVNGAGIEVRLEDAKTTSKSLEAQKDPNLGHLQADDLLKLVNELKAGGATAIAINDQRLVSTSEIVTSGKAISVNKTRLSQPVIVTALGDTHLLWNTLKFRGGVLEYLDFFEINVTLKKSKQLTLPAYKGSL